MYQVLEFDVRSIRDVPLGRNSIIKITLSEATPYGIFLRRKSPGRSW